VLSLSGLSRYAHRLVFQNTYLPELRVFRFFVGNVQLSIGTLLLYEFPERAQARKARSNELDIKFAEQAKLISEQHKFRTPAGLPRDTVVETITFNRKIIEYEFWGERFRFSVPAMFPHACVVGIGGAILAPFCETVFPMPVSTVAGAALLGTCFTSIVEVFFYSVLPAAGGVARLLRTGRRTSSSAEAGLRACISARRSSNMDLSSSSSSSRGS